MNYRNMTNDELLNAAADCQGLPGTADMLLAELLDRLAAAIADQDREACPFELVAEKHGIWSSAELDVLLARVPE